MDIGSYSLSEKDRARGVYVIGGSGSGKSTLLLGMALQDAQEGHGLCFIDPHGDTAREFLERVHESRAGDVIYVDPSDRDSSPALNPFDAPYADPSTNADNIVAAFRARFGESWGPSLERLFLFSTMALVECQDATLLSIPQMFHSKAYRAYVLKTVTNPLVAAFWREEFPKWNDRMLDQRLDPVLNKVERTLMHPAIMNILGQPRGKLNMRTIMDERQILIINLSKGALGLAGSLLGSFTVSLIAQAALSRQDTPPELRKPFHLYVDEFQNAVTDSFDDIASEARKYRLSLTLAHQFFGQVPERVRKSALANCKNLISFNVGADDAPLIAEQLGWENPRTLMELPDYSVMARLHMVGRPSQVLQIALDPLPTVSDSFSSRIIRRSQNEHSRPRSVVEGRIRRFLTAEKTGKKKGRRPSRPGKPEANAWA